VKEYENGDGAQHREEWLLDRLANKSAAATGANT
jgi:hypothetical protein